MSYGLAIAGDARPNLRALDYWLQEEFFDELEIIASDPSLLPFGSATDGDSSSRVAGELARRIPIR